MVHSQASMSITNRCAKHPQHAYSRGVWGHAPQKTFENYMSGEQISVTKITCTRHISALVLEQKSLHRNSTLPLKQLTSQLARILHVSVKWTSIQQQCQHTISSLRLLVSSLTDPEAKDTGGCDIGCKLNKGSIIGDGKGGAVVQPT